MSQDLATKKLVGRVGAIHGLIVEVELSGDKPEEKELLLIEDCPDARVEVSYFTRTSAVAVNLTNSTEIRCGQKVYASGEKVSVPVGPSTLGRMFNAMGKPIDNGEEILDMRRNISKDTGKSSKAKYNYGAKFDLLETGLKVIDFMTPFVKGRKVGIIGGAGVGKTVLTMEMIYNVTRSAKGLSIYCGVGERIREGNELYETLKDTGVLKNTVLFYGQMDSIPAIRSMVGPAAATAAEYFRDEEGKDILFFVDNIYRHIQALTEISTNMGLIPSEGGYSPYVFSELRRLEDRLSSSPTGSITSVQAIYVPADDLSDPAVQAISQQLDSVLVLSRTIAEQGIRPAVDLLKSTSSLLTPSIVGERHYKLVADVQAIMQKYESLKNIIAIVGENELSPEDRSDYQKAKMLIQFFSQDFSVAEKLTGKPGEFFTREQTLDGVESIVRDGVLLDQSAETRNTKSASSASSPAKEEEKPKEEKQEKPTETAKDDSENKDHNKEEDTAQEENKPENPENNDETKEEDKK